MRNPDQAVLYPCTGLLEGANLSVGRGTDEPFELFGAPWIDGPRLCDALRAAALPGLEFTPIEFTPDASKFKDEPCQGVHVTVTDRDALRPVASGLAIMWHLDRLFGRAFEAADGDARLRSASTWEALLRRPTGAPSQPRGHPRWRPSAASGSPSSSTPTPDEVPRARSSRWPPAPRPPFVIETEPPTQDPLVEVAAQDGRIRVLAVYATPNNFVGEALYPEPRIFLRRSAMERLSRVQSALESRGMGLMVFDGYRPGR